MIPQDKEESVFDRIYAELSKIEGHLARLVEIQDEKNTGPSPQPTPDMVRQIGMELHRLIKAEP